LLYRKPHLYSTVPQFSNMPAWDDICNAAFSNAAFSTALPLGIASVGLYLYSKAKDQQEWFAKFKKPSWFISNPVGLSAVDLATLAPIGYAAHQICKTLPSSDRQWALGLYGAGLAVWLAGTQVFPKTKDLRCLALVTGSAAVVHGATAAAFYKLNENAGLMLVPLTAWMAYETVGVIAIMQANPGL